jgi:hypothetical protein
LACMLYPHNYVVVQRNGRSDAHDAFILAS